MSKSVNRVMLLGNVGKPPELRSPSSGTMIATFSLATTDRKKDQQGNWKDSTTWHNVVCFGRTAEVVSDYVAKGSKVYVEGKIQNRTWEKDGQKHYRTEVIVNELVLLSGGEKRESMPDSRPVDDSDIPF